MSLEQLAFDQIHIDIARNSTDDFNPFHDPQRFSNIQGNPFTGPIALGFQMEFLCSDRILRRRAEEHIQASDSLAFRNFEFSFAGALSRSEAFALDVRKTVDRSAQGGGVSNRVVLRKSDGTPVLIGTQSDTVEPRVSGGAEIGDLPPLAQLPDRSTVPGSDLFLKRKFLMTSNAKNFALGALCRQHDYIDELAEHVRFAPLFTASLVSCALLERGTAQGHDFQAEPMVYTSHQISVDMRVQRKLRSNDAVHILVAQPQIIPPGKGLGKVCVEQQLVPCTAVVSDSAILFRARMQLAPLNVLTDGDPGPVSQDR